MKKQEPKKPIGCLPILIFMFMVPIFFSMCSLVGTKQYLDYESPVEMSNENTFHLLSSSENQDLEPLLLEFAKNNNIDLQITYSGTIDMMQTLNYKSEEYDATWSSNSIWLYMLEDSVKGKIKDSKFVSINPVVFALDKNKAKELGFVDNPDLEMRDIINAVREDGIEFIMPSATQTNSGASAYLGFLTSLAGNPQVLTTEDLEKPELQKELVELFENVRRSSGSEEYSVEAYSSGDYDGLVGYESSIISLNQELEKAGKTPLYALYPKDGVSLSDSPFAYIDNGNKDKKEEFQQLQNFLLQEDTQKKLTQTGRRAGYGGLVPYGDNKIFRPEWGMNTDHYLTSIRYPSSGVMIDSLNLYQEYFRRPSYTIFVLDYSGSMYGEGQEQLDEAMTLILDQQRARERMIQFGEKDKIRVYSFDTDTLGQETIINGLETQKLLDFLETQEPMGGTNIYISIAEELQSMTQEDKENYNISFVLMTDGQANTFHGYDIIKEYYASGTDFPIFAIVFGDAYYSELEELADLSGGRLFDGKEDLIHAFQTVRGYN